MLYLILGLVLFIGGHLFTAMRDTRQKVIGKIGENPYKAIYSVVALLGIILIVVGMRGVASVNLWTVPQWGNQVTGILMVISFIMFAAYELPSNIKRVTRHPMLWGVVFWSGAHLLSNSELASLILFGSVGVYSLTAMWLANQRNKSALSGKQPVKMDVMAVVIGLVAYAGVRYFHP